MSKAERSTAVSGSGGGDVGKYIHLVLRYAWLVLLTTAIGLVLGLLFTKEEAPLHTSTATIMIQPAAPSIVGDVDSALMMWSAYLDGQRFRSTQFRIMTSSMVLSQVAERLDLANDPEFLGLTAIEDEEERARALESADPVPLLRSMIRVEPDEDTMMVHITVQCSIARYCSRIANALAQTYVEYNYTQRISSGASAEDWLREQYQQLRSQLEASEERLLEYRSERDLLSVSLDDQFNLTARALETTTTQLAAAEHEVDRLSTAVQMIQRIRRERDYFSVGLMQVVDNALIQQLKGQLFELQTERIDLASRYLEQHPLMVTNQEKTDLVRTTLEQEIDNSLASLQLEYDTAVHLRDTLRSRLSQTYEQAMGLGSTQLDYDRIEREVETNRTVFQALDGRLREVELANQLEPNNVQLLEPAPEQPVRLGSGGLPLFLMTALVGFGIGLGIAVLMEMLDQTVKTQQQLENDFALPFLGLVPSMSFIKSAGRSQRGPRRGESYNPDFFVHEYPKSSVAESCRSIRTNLLFMATEKPLRRLMVTSSGPLEGKTTIAISMATIIAQSGSRVLLIDNDLRRPRLHVSFQLQDARLGLTSLLLGQATPEHCIQQTSIPGVDLLPCGAIPPNPTELMHSARFREVIDELDSRYDVLIFDAPPVSPVTDAVVLSSLVDGVLLVVRANKTRRDLLASTIDKLDAVGANLLGAVLNDVDLNSRRSGHYYYYYRHYGQYYGSDEDVEA